MSDKLTLSLSSSSSSSSSTNTNSNPTGNIFSSFINIRKVFGSFLPDKSLEDIPVKKSSNGISRSITAPCAPSENPSKRLRDETEDELPSSKGSKCSNGSRISKKEDPGYTGTKSMGVVGKSYEYMRYTEDRSITIKYTPQEGCGYTLMVVADGHGSSYQCAKIITAYMGINFELIAKSLYVPGKELNASEVLTKLFADTQSYCNNNRDLLIESGSTCCACIISESTGNLTVANLGDSVCMVVSGDKKTFRTRDQDASSEIEQTRIKGINPRARFIGSRGDPAIRLNGALMTVGGFGDYRHDLPLGVIRRVPEITTHQLVQGDHIILSSDGLYETYLPHGMLGGGRPDENIVRLCSDYSQQVELQNNSLANFLFESHIEEIANQLRDSRRYNPATPREVLLEQARNGKDNTVILVYTV